MRKSKKFASTALALAMILSMGTTAFAAPGDMACDPDVSISGLQGGDSVQFYQVLAWNDGWVTAPGFESMAGSLEEIAHGSVVANGDGTEHTTAGGGISSELAGQLGSLASSATPVTTITANGGSVVYDGPAPGLYMGIITAGTPGYFYNPVFVAADFNPNNAAGLTLNENELSYDDQARAKVNRIGVEKTSGSITSDAAQYDPIDFTVKTMVPTYAGNYVDPVFKITDVLSDGLAFQPDTWAISGTWVKTGASVDFEDGAYAFAFDEAANTYTVTFSGDYLKAITDQINLEITYKAIITDTAASVNPEDNTVTVNFSNRPDDTTGAGILRDRTNHYTFTIDGMLWGQDGYEASEIVKVGMDADGNEITETRELSNGSSIGALEGAKFVLYKSEAGAKADDADDIYTNDVFDGYVVSDADGRMHIEGLDEGVYYLKESEAPAGYIKSQDIVKIEIETSKTVVPVEEEEDGQKIVYDVEVLTGYQIYMTVGDGARQNTANYVFTNDGPVLTEVTRGDLAGTDGELGKVFNTVGVELPSTGGIGTTIFYIVGGCLVLGAGVLLVVKKRVGGKEEA